MKIVIGCFLVGLYLGVLGAERYWMPGWMLGLGTVALIGLTALLWQHSKLLAFIGASILGVVLAFFSMPFLEEAEDPLILSTQHATFVVRNHCFLDCRPVVYKKYPYLPLLQKYQALEAEQAIQNHRLQNDTLYLSNGQREWKIY